MANQYYSDEDLARFSEIGKNGPDLAAKFFDWYGAVFADGACRLARSPSSRWPSRMRCSARTASTRTAGTRSRRAPTRPDDGGRSRRGRDSRRRVAGPRRSDARACREAGYVRCRASLLSRRAAARRAGRAARACSAAAARLRFDEAVERAGQWPLRPAGSRSSRSTSESSATRPAATVTWTPARTGARK